MSAWIDQQNRDGAPRVIAQLPMRRGASALDRRTAAETRVH